MQILVVAAFVLLVVVGVINHQKSSLDQPSPTTEPTITTHQESSPAEIQSSPTITVLNTTKPSLKPSPSSQLNISESDWQYPGSIILSSDNYSSTESPDSITSWYENKVRNLGFSVNTFVKTSANDTILNKLSAAKSGQSITIEISRPSGNSTTEIIVRLDN